MAESRRGKLTPRTIKVKLRDSVSVSDGKSKGSGSSSSGGKSSGGGITTTVQTTKTKRPSSVFRNKSIQNRRDAQRLQTAKTVKSRRLGLGQAGLLYGAKAVSRLRSQTEEERKKEPLPVQISQGVAEGIGQTAFVLGSAPIVVGEDIKNLIEGKPFRPEGNFFEQVLKETRPSTLSQGFSQITPGAKKEPVSFDPTSLSRAGGEFVGLYAGAKVLNIGTPKIPASSSSRARGPQFGFTKTNVNLGQGRVGPFTGPDVPFTPAQVQPTGPLLNLGRGVGKTVLRDTPRRSPFTFDRTTGVRGGGGSLPASFKSSSSFNLGRGVSKFIEGSAKQTQQTGQKTIVRTKQAKVTRPKTELDILRQGPRFKGTRISAGEAGLETVRFPKQTRAFKPIAGAALLGGAAATALGQPTKTQPSFKLNAIPKSTFKFTDALKVKKGSRGITTPRSTFRFRDDTSFKLTTTPKLGTPFIQQSALRQPPPQRPPPPLKPPGFAPFGFGRPVSLSSFGQEQRGSSKVVYGAFAISENINIGRLPGPLSEFSTSSKVFGKLDKRDKAFQEAIFGKPKRKSKKVKGKKRKRKR